MRELAPRLLVVGHDAESGALGEAIDRSEFDPDVVTVADRGAARETLRRQRIDCVVSDYEIPDEAGRTYMGGLRLLESVRNEHGDLPFVLFTDVVNEDSTRLAAANGVRAYVRDREGENVVGQLRYHVDSAVRGRLAERRAAEQDRINELMRGVTQTLVLEEDRDAMLAALCAELTGQDVYRYAAYHQRSSDSAADGSSVAGPATGTDATLTGLDAEPEAAAGTADDDAGATSLLRRCIDRGEVETAQLRRSVGATDDVDDADATATSAWETVLRVAVPIGYEAERFGVLVLETDPEHAFFESETDVLAELGEAIGHAINAVETREALRDREAELEHRTEQLEGFASLVSHDVRNPLNVAQGYVELLAERVDDDAVDEIAESLDRIETIVADILALTRSGGDLDVAPTDLETVVADAWASVDTRNATLAIGGGAGDGGPTAGSGGLPRVEADASQLQRVFENLFRNSIEHGTPDGGDIAVAVAFERGEDPVRDDEEPTGGDEADVVGGELVVEDDGVGFPEGAIDGLFEFGEMGSSGGTGLGLAIVGDLVEHHGWSVTAENREAGGARFRIAGIEPLA